MGRWKLNLWKCVLLLSMLFLFFLILVLPQVDLPDTAFHRNTAPIVIHSRYTSPPAALPGSAILFASIVMLCALRDRRREFSVAHFSSSSVSLDSILRC